MGQDLVCAYFMKNPTRWVSIKELHEAIPSVGTGSLGVNCKKLYKYGFLDRQKVIQHGYAVMFQYKYKIPSEVV